MFYCNLLKRTLLKCWIPAHKNIYFNNILIWLKIWWKLVSTTRTLFHFVLFNISTHAKKLHWIQNIFTEANLNYLEVAVCTELEKKPKFSVVQLAGARAHQVDQVEVVLQVCQDLHLAEERRQLRPVERVVDRLDGHLRHGTRIEKALGVADVHAAEVAAAQQLPNFEFWSDGENIIWYFNFSFILLWQFTLSNFSKNSLTLYSHFWTKVARS